MSDQFTNFNPEPGNATRRPLNRVNTEPTTYSDIDSLREDLADLISEIDGVQGELDREMEQFALPAGDFDTRLIDAMAEEWPDNLGSTPEYVSYRFYRALRFRDTTAASYIRQRFEEAARDVLGVSALDLMHLNTITRDEALLITSFLDDNIGSTDDSSEHRVLEIFQDWVQPALVQTQKLRTYRQSSPTRALTDEQVEAASPGDARRGQAVLKARLNAANGRIAKDMDLLRRNFSEFAPVFYDRFLGPALRFRSDVSLKSGQTAKNQVAQEVNDSASVLDLNLRNVLADQGRRRALYNNKVAKIFEDVQLRDTYRSGIHQLAEKGKPLPQAGARVMVKVEEGLDEVLGLDGLHSASYDDAVPTVLQGVTPAVVSLHAQLGGRQANDHPQYLLRAGGLITGDVVLGPDGTVDGMKPSLHRHTGEDGSSKIHGSDIIGGTITDDLVDPESRPETPENLAVDNFKTTIVPPGVTMVDAVLSWDGDSNASGFEVQLTRVGE